MPIPEVKSGENEKEYISRCMSVLADEYDDNSQRYAICIGKFQDKNNMSVLKEMFRKSNDVSRLASSINEITLDFATIGPRGGVNPSKKAPKSGTPNPNPQRGSDKNKPGAASTGRGVEVPQRVLDSLQKKADEWNEKYKEKRGYGANVGALKTVYQRGVGAFQTSHSPKVKSSEQWGQARVNAFLYLLKEGRPQNPKYVGDNDLLPKGHPKSDK